MDERKISWPGWETVRLIGRGSFGAVYEIQRDVFGETEKAALKVISIPQNDSDIDEMYNDGYDDESITSTFQSHLRSIVAEYSLMRKMNGHTNIVSCDDMRHIQHDDGIGWDIFIKMELLTPLAKALPGDIGEQEAIRVAKDICGALVLCSKYNVIHRDIKPQNIFVSEHGDYKLGDFGIAKTVEKTMGGTKIGTYKYMAPEVYNNQPYGHSADIYSLGLVLYWLLNERRMPFLPLPPAKLKAGMEEEARERRLRGEPLPAPAHGSKALQAIVLKACAFDPAERYHTAAEMLQDLEKLGGAVVTGPVPEVDPDEERLRKEKEERERKEKEERARKEAEEKARRKAENNSQAETNQKQPAAKQSKKRHWIVVAVLALVFALVATCLFHACDSTASGNSSAKKWEGVNELSLASRNTNFAYLNYWDGASRQCCAIIDGRGHLWLWDTEENTVLDTNVENVKDVAVVHENLYYLTTRGTVWKANVQWNSGWDYLGAEQCKEWKRIERIYGDYSELVLVNKKGCLLVGKEKSALTNVVDVQCRAGSVVVRTQSGECYGFGENHFGVFTDNTEQSISHKKPALLSFSSELQDMRIVRECGVQRLQFATLALNGMLAIYDDTGMIIVESDIPFTDIVAGDCALYMLASTGVDGNVYGYGEFSSGCSLSSNVLIEQSVTRISEFDGIDYVYALAPQNWGCLLVDFQGRCYSLHQKGFSVVFEPVKCSDETDFIYDLGI